MRLTHQLSIYLEATFDFIEIALAKRDMKQQHLRQRRVSPMPRVVLKALTAVTFGQN